MDESQTAQKIIQEALAAKTIIYAGKTQSTSKTIVFVGFIAWLFCAAFCLVSWIIYQDMPTPVLMYATGLYGAVLTAYFTKAGFENVKSQDGVNGLTAQTVKLIENGQHGQMERGENI